jgi:sigma-B regulation protein RsbU (phosphoserine phosphatase)
MMPRMDGFETLRRIRERPETAQVPVIMLTARAQLADRMAGFDRGADDYLPKPFEPRELVARIESLLRRTEQARLTSPLMGLLGDWSSAEGVAQFGRDLEAARDIQARLLPAVPPILAGLEAGAALRPSTVVGGDFFDVVPMHGRLGVAIGDVSGKGIAAALLMVMVRTLLREVARSLVEPAEVLTRLNASLCRDMPPSMFVTTVLAVLDPARPGHLLLANGGHSEPVVLRRTGAPAVLDVGGMMVGAFPDVTFEQSEVDLAAGEMLVLYTDGVLETPDESGKRPGLPRLLEILDEGRGAGAAALAHAVTDDVVARAGSRLRDDAAVFVLKR